MNQPSPPESPVHKEPCPSWCIRIHGEQRGEEDLIHLSRSLLVRRNLVRLCSTVDPESRTVSGPYVLVGEEEYTLHEAEVLLGALAQLLDEAADVALDVPRQRAERPDGARWSQRRPR